MKNLMIRNGAITAVLAIALGASGYFNGCKSQAKPVQTATTSRPATQTSQPSTQSSQPASQSLEETLAYREGIIHYNPKTRTLQAYFEASTGNLVENARIVEINNSEKRIAYSLINKGKIIAVRTLSDHTGGGRSGNTFYEDFSKAFYLFERENTEPANGKYGLELEKRVGKSVVYDTGKAIPEDRLAYFPKINVPK